MECPHENTHFEDVKVVTPHTPPSSTLIIGGFCLCLCGVMITDNRWTTYAMSCIHSHSQGGIVGRNLEREGGEKTRRSERTNRTSSQVNCFPSLIGPQVHVI